MIDYLHKTVGMNMGNDARTVNLIAMNSHLNTMALFDMDSKNDNSVAMVKDNITE